MYQQNVSNVQTVFVTVSVSVFKKTAMCFVNFFIIFDVFVNSPLTTTHV